VCLLLNYTLISGVQARDVEAQRKELQKKIRHVEWLENVEQNKLYKNQQKLENAQTNLKESEKQVDDAKQELSGMQGRLEKATAEYNRLNLVMSNRIRKIFKTQRKALFELVISSEDINMLVDRIYFQRLILKDDLARMEIKKKKL